MEKDPRAVDDIVSAIVRRVVRSILSFAPVKTNNLLCEDYPCCKRSAMAVR